ncbi:protein kinase [Kitasatospora sp. MBT63]|uniref:protein kinase domain-containing protein n=1 Tax=Kitasatospora sp. MBT63 TaxID=1444768 RepID=UPI0009EBCA1F|nr:protein kinase [Kitasatospora sp. MBT63]
MSEDANPVAGHSLGNGRYVIQRLLGQGGMASVHLAHDTVLDRLVAVKTLNIELGGQAAFKERFRREAQAVARLQHTNIVSVFDSGEDVTAEGLATPYIVMEYVEGQALGDVLKDTVSRQGAMSTDQALKITASVLSALEASHDQGLVHRDIKPGNVMVSSKGVIKVMDFGIARALQSGVTSMTQTGMVVGTPQYLSPEQALGKSVDARADLYSVGCMLFELLTGRLPFDGDTAFTIAYKHVQEEPPAPSTVNAAVPPAVDALVARALRKDPAHRFPTAEAMREEVERISGGDKGGIPLQASTPLVISEGPRSVHAAPSMTNFPQVTGDIRTPAPQVQPHYQPAPQTPSPYQAPQTPHPFAQAPQTPAPFPQQAHTPPPFPQPGYRTPHPFPQQAHPTGPMPTGPMPMQPGPMQPGPMQPGPYGPRPANSNNGCSTALIVVGVIVGVIVLAVVIVAIVAAKDKTNTTDTDPYGAGRPAVTLDLGAVGGDRI